MPTRTSEFGLIVGNMNRGSLIQTERDPGEHVFVSSAFNPLRATELRRIAEKLDELNDPFHDEGNATNHRVSQCTDRCRER